MSVNFTKGVQLNLTANFGGFNTTLYRNQGCTSTTCEGVEELKDVMVSERPLQRKEVRSSEHASVLK